MQCQLGQRCHLRGLEAIVAHLEPSILVREVLSRPLWEAGRLRENCQAEHKYPLGSCFSPCLGSLPPIPRMLGFGGILKNPVPLFTPAMEACFRLLYMHECEMEKEEQGHRTKQGTLNHLSSDQ